AIDQGGCLETSRPTTHAKPTYIVDDIVHYCVTNMPGAVGRTSTYALTNVTLPYAVQLANKGVEAAIRENPGLAAGVNIKAGQVKELLEGNFPAVWVAGEVSNFTRATSGHMYLTLKDAQSQVRCAFFRGFNLRLKFDPHDGLEVIARGRLSFYGPRGDCQFY